MNCVSCDVCVYHLGLCVFSPGVFLSSRVTGACPVTTDLIMRVNVRTTTTITKNRFRVPGGIISQLFPTKRDKSKNISVPNAFHGFRT